MRMPWDVLPSCLQRRNTTSAHSRFLISLGINTREDIYRDNRSKGMLNTITFFASSKKGSKFRKYSTINYKISRHQKNESRTFLVGSLKPQSALSDREGHEALLVVSIYFAQGQLRSISPRSAPARLEGAPFVALIQHCIAAPVQALRGSEARLRSPP